MKPAELPALTGVRFFAAFWVVLYHLQYKLPLAGITWGKEFIAQGRLAVPFFFILSGFILMHVYARDYRLSDHPRFIWLRFARLWPVHVVALAGLVLYVAALTAVRGYKANPLQDFSRLFADLSMFRGWYDSEMIWNFPSWSIQAEWFAYIALFPVCVAAFRKAAYSWLLVVAILIFLGAQSTFESTLPGFTGRITCLFLAGAALYRLYELNRDLPGPFLVNVSLAFLSASLWFHWPPYTPFCGLILGLAYGKGAVARFLSTRPVLHGGQISYSLYMTHFVVNIWMWELWGRLHVSALWTIALTVATSLVTAAAVHRYVEVPTNSWLRNLNAPRITRSQPSIA